MQTRATDFGHVVVLEPGDELLDSLKRFAGESGTQTAFLGGIGAVDSLELGYFHPSKGEYAHRVLDEQLEVLTITGNLSLKDGKPHPHVHGIFGRSDFSTIGGHVFRAVCSVTLEIAVTTTSEPIVRAPVDYVDLELMQPEASR